MSVANRPAGQVSQQQTSPKVPETVAAGTYATGTVIMHTRDEFVMDFIVALRPPLRVVARVVLAPCNLKRFHRAVVDNLSKYEQKFETISEQGKEPAATSSTTMGPGDMGDEAEAVKTQAEVASPGGAVQPANPGGQPPQPGVAAPQVSEPRPTAPPPDLYNQLRIPDPLLSGVYANVVMVGHTRGEFIIDFLTSFRPIANTCARIIMGPVQVKMLAKALAENIRQYEQRFSTIDDTVDQTGPVMQVDQKVLH